MKVNRLREHLTALGVEPQAYRIGDRGPADETYHLAAEPTGGWTIRYLERGTASVLHHLTTESEACERFVQILLDDPSTRAVADHPDA